MLETPKKSTIPPLILTPFPSTPPHTYTSTTFGWCSNRMGLHILISSPVSAVEYKQSPVLETDLTRRKKPPPFDTPSYEKLLHSTTLPVHLSTTPLHYFLPHFISPHFTIQHVRPEKTPESSGHLATLKRTAFQTPSHVQDDHAASRYFRFVEIVSGRESDGQC